LADVLFPFESYGPTLADVCERRHWRTFVKDATGRRLWKTPLAVARCHSYIWNSSFLTLIFNNINLIIINIIKNWKGGPWIEYLPSPRNCLCSPIYLVTGNSIITWHLLKYWVSMSLSGVLYLEYFLSCS
jgi:hypothetical protein